MELLSRLSVVILLLLFPPPALALGGAFVGNGGEGVIVGKAIVLRDFFEAGLEHPVVGGSAGAEISELVDNFLEASPLPIDADLLKRKLTDLDQVRPGLGKIAALVMVNYSWRFNDSMTAAPNPRDPLPGANQSRIELATRLGNAIYLSAGAFSRLAPVQKVGLILHEALFALLIPQCSRISFICDQKAAVVRELIARTFTAHAAEDSKLKELLGVSLAAIDAAEACRIPAVEAELSVDNAFSSRSSPGPGEKVMGPRDFAGMTDPQLPAVLAPLLCSEGAVPGHAPLFRSAKITSKFIKVVFKLSGSPTGGQLFAVTRLDSEASVVRNHGLSSSQCEENLRSSISTIIDHFAFSTAILPLSKFCAPSRR